MSLSVALATYNEEKNITDCLKSVANIADEIIIVDGQSQDKTAHIAKSFRAKVISVPNNPQFHVNKQIAIDNCQSDWILQLDADERLSPELAKEIKKIASSKPLSSEENGYYLPRRNYFLGKFLTKGGAYPDPVIRLFRKGKARFDRNKIIDNGITTANVHAQLVIDGKIGTLKHDLIHYGDISISSYFKRFNRYTSLEAENLVSLNKKVCFLNYFVWLPIYWFFKRFIRHKGFVDGYQGFLFALFSCLHYPMIWIKCKEILNN